MMFGRRRTIPHGFRSPRNNLGLFLPIIICNIEYIVFIRVYHPSKSPNPILRFFFGSSAAPSPPSCGRFKFKYFPTDPPAELDSKAEPVVPTFTPNQLIPSEAFFSGALWTFLLCSASARLASFFARRVLYSSKGSWYLFSPLTVTAILGAGVYTHMTISVILTGFAGRSVPSFKGSFSSASSTSSPPTNFPKTVCFLSR